MPDQHRSVDNPFTTQEQIERFEQTAGDLQTQLTAYTKKLADFQDAIAAFRASLNLNDNTITQLNDSFVADNVLMTQHYGENQSSAPTSSTAPSTVSFTASSTSTSSFKSAEEGVESMNCGMKKRLVQESQPVVCNGNSQQRFKFTRQPFGDTSSDEDINEREIKSCVFDPNVESLAEKQVDQVQLPNALQTNIDVSFAQLASFTMENKENKPTKLPVSITFRHVSLKHKLDGEDIVELGEGDLHLRKHDSGIEMRFVVPNQTEAVFHIQPKVRVLRSQSKDFARNWECQKDGKRGKVIGIFQSEVDVTKFCTFL